MTDLNDKAGTNPALTRRQALGLLGAGTAALGFARPVLAHDDHDTVLTEALVLRDPDVPVIGNPNGDISIVEWYDYNCPYCRKVAPELRQVVEDDGKVRLVLKDWPILGEVSKLSARLVLAAKYQDKFLPAHEALIGVSSRLTEPRVRELLAGAGVDMDRLKKDLAANSKTIDAILARNNDQALAFEFRGTPVFIVGKYRVPGVLSLKEFEQVIADARQAKRGRGGPPKEKALPPRRERFVSSALAPLLRRDLDPLLMGARLQRLPAGGRNIPVDDGAVGRGRLAAGNARCLRGIIDVDAAHQQQCTQDHSEKNPHDTPPVADITWRRSDGSRLRSNEGHFAIPGRSFPVHPVQHRHIHLARIGMAEIVELAIGHIGACGRQCLLGLAGALHRKHPVELAV